jgi:hypothetical protein
MIRTSALVLTDFRIMEFPAHIAIRISLAPVVPLLQSILAKTFPWEGLEANLHAHDTFRFRMGPCVPWLHVAVTTLGTPQGGEIEVDDNVAAAILLGLPCHLAEEDELLRRRV